MAIKLLTPVFRVSFPQVFVARAMQPGQDAKYSLVMLFDIEKINASKEEKKLWADMQIAAKEVAAEKWPKGLPKGLMNPFRDGMEKEQYEGYGEDVTFITASTKTKPGLVDQNLQKIIAPEEFYPGCFARATVNAYAWSKLGKNGVSFGLQNIQKVKDGDALGGRTRAEEDFSVLDDLENGGEEKAKEVNEDPTEMFG
jgi:hypothetical protein